MALKRRDPICCFYAELKFTVKITKFPPEIRGLHACANHPFRPLMQFVAAVINRVLDKLEHNVKDSKSLVASLRKIMLPVDGETVTKFVTFDIKDFFMSDSHKGLAHASRSIVVGDTRKALFFDAVVFLLKSQGVHIKQCNLQVDMDSLDESELCRVFCELYKVNCGSGMGLPSSDPLSSLHFYESTEKWLELKSTKRAFGIIRYYRFKDDILLLSNAPEVKLGFMLECMNACVADYKIVCSSISRFRVRFLDLMICSQDGQIVTYPVHKTLRQGSSLLHCSGHPPRQHMSWPLARCFALSALCTNAAHVKLVQQILLLKLMCEIPDHPMIPKIVDHVIRGGSRCGIAKVRDVVSRQSLICAP